MRTAEHVYTRAEDLQRLREKIEALPNGAHVEIELDGGEHLVGIVGARPSLQQFFDRSGSEGTNATVRLEKPALYHPRATPAPLDLWLDRIVRIQRLPPQDELHDRPH